MKKATVLLLLVIQFQVSYSQQKERMVAMSDFHNLYNPSNQRDSNTYIYSDTLGGIQSSFEIEYGYLEVTYNATGFNENTQYNFDSSIWSQTTRTVNTYDALNRLINSTGEEYTNDQWMVVGQNIYVYDDSGILISNTSQLYINGSWQDQSRYVYSYNPLHTILTDDMEVYDSITGGWDAQSGDTIIYDGAGHVISNTQFSIAAATASSPAEVIFFYYNFYYDSNGNQIEYTYESNTDAYGPDSKYVRVYDTNNNKVADTIFFLIGNEWIYSYYDTLTYDSHRNVLTQPAFRWEPTYGGWQNYTLVTYQYDNNNNNTSWIYYTGAINSSIWLLNTIDSMSYNLNKQKTSIQSITYLADTIYNGTYQVFTYDLNNNLSSFIEYEWDNGWVPSQGRWDMTYDTLNYLTNCLFTAYNYQSQTWGVSNGIHYWYETVALPQPFFDKALNTSVYPNPATGQFAVAFDVERQGTVTLNLYDLSGRLITSTITRAQSGSNTLEYNAVALSPGVYLYDVTINGSRGQGKVVIE